MGKEDTDYNEKLIQDKINSIQEEIQGDFYLGDV